MKNKFLKKILCVGLLGVSLLGFNFINANAETIQTTNHYNQWVQINGQWEYYNSLGQLMKDCWIRSLDGKYYYLDDNGIMVTSKWVDNYYVGTDGAWITNITIPKTNDNTYVKKQVDAKTTDSSKTNSDTVDKENDYSSYQKKNVKDNTNVNKTTSESSSSSTSSTSDDDYYDYSSKGSNETYVSGYYRKNGTYVSGHYRTKKDNTTSNNYSHKGNVNPHNGKRGYKK